VTNEKIKIEHNLPFLFQKTKQMKCLMKGPSFKALRPLHLKAAGLDIQYELAFYLDAHAGLDSNRPGSAIGIKVGGGAHARVNRRGAGPAIGIIIGQPGSHSWIFNSS
jgi:hypothetical protein